MYFSENYKRMKTHTRTGILCVLGVSYLIMMPWLNAIDVGHIAGHLVFQTPYLPHPKCSTNTSARGFNALESGTPKAAEMYQRRLTFLFGTILPISMGELGLHGECDTDAPSPTSPVRPKPPPARCSLPPTSPVSLAGNGRGVQEVAQGSDYGRAQVPPPSRST